MYIRNKLLCMAGVCGLIVTTGPIAKTTETSWPVYRADAIGYYQSQLPYAIVIYVFSPQGNLTSVVNPHGHNDEKAMNALAKTISSQNFAKMSDVDRRNIGKSLGDFLLDQGYSIHQIVNSRTKFTLVLTMPQIKKTDCQNYINVENRFKQVIGQSIPVDAKGWPLYSVAILEIGSPKLKLKCVK